MGLQKINEFDSQYLLFEDQFGDGELFSANELNDLMKKSAQDFQLQVVYVAACDSEDVGRIFKNNGAKHVICVEKGRQVLDKATIYFTNIFYYRIFKERD